MPKEKYLVALACFFATLLAASLFLLAAQPQAQEAQATCAETLFPGAEGFAQMPATAAAEPLRLNELKIVVLADADIIKAAREFFSGIPNQALEFEFVTPEGFEAKKQGSLIAVVFGLDSSTAMRNIVGGIVSDEELSLAEKSRVPLSLLKENVFRQEQQVAVYLGRTKGDALRALKSSFAPLDEEKISGQALSTSPPDARKSQNAQQQPALGNLVLGIASGLVSLPEPMEEGEGIDIEGFYQDNYQELDEAYPSVIWDLGNCWLVLTGGTPLQCDGQMASYIARFAADSKGIHLLEDLHQAVLPADEAIDKKYRGIILGGTEGMTEEQIVSAYGLQSANESLTKGNYPHCYTYKPFLDMHVWLNSGGFGNPYEYFIKSQNFELILPRCITTHTIPPNITIKVLLLNSIFERVYEAHYYFAGNPGYVLPEAARFRYDSQIPVQILNRKAFDYYAFGLQSFDVLELEYKGEQGASQPEDTNAEEFFDWKKTTYAAALPEFFKDDGSMPPWTFFFHTLKRPTLINANYEIYYKLALENKQLWSGGSGDYAEKDFVENFLLGSGGFIKKGTEVWITAPSQSPAGDPFYEWLIDGQSMQGLPASEYWEIDAANPRRLRLLMAIPYTIEAKFKPDFSVSDIPGVISVEQGGRAGLEITVSSARGTGTKPVEISIERDDNETMPYTFDAGTSAPLAAGASRTARFEMQTQYSTPPWGEYRFRVKVRAGNSLDESRFYVRVMEKGWDFSLASGAAPKLIDAGQSASFDIALKSENGFGLPVRLSAEGLPQGASYSFSENPAMPNPDGTKNIRLSIQTDGSMPAGIHQIKIAADSDWKHWGASASASVILYVSRQIPAGEDFTIGIIPESASSSAYGTLNFLMTLTPTSGFSSSIIFVSVEHLPQNSSATLGSYSVVLQANASQAIPITINVSADPGTYTFSANAIGGGRSHAKLGTITVT
ncbi:MAG: hypothetical protein V1676_00980 [Candidatus Diapherotrites archaeon]